MFGFLVEMAQGKKRSEAASLEKTQDFERQFSKMNEMLESLMTSRANSTPREGQHSLNILLAGPDINEKLSVQVELLFRGDST